MQWLQQCLSPSPQNAAALLESLNKMPPSESTAAAFPLNQRPPMVPFLPCPFMLLPIPDLLHIQASRNTVSASFRKGRSKNWRVHVFFFESARLHPLYWRLSEQMRSYTISSGEGPMDLGVEDKASCDARAMLRILCGLAIVLAWICTSTGTELHFVVVREASQPDLFSFRQPT